MKQKMICRFCFFMAVIASAFCLCSSSSGNGLPADTQKILKYLDLVHYYTRKTNIDSAIYYQEKAFEHISQAKTQLSYNMLIKIAESLEAEHNEVGALEYYMYALDLVDDEKQENIKRKITIYQKIAFCQKGYNPQKALEYWRQSISLAEEYSKTDTTYDIAEDRIAVYNNIGSIYNDHNEPDSARTYYEKALASIAPEDSTLLGKLYNNLGVVQAQKNNINAAYALFQKAIGYADKANDSTNKSNIYLNIGKCHFIKSEYKPAINFLEKSLCMSNATGNLRNSLLANEFLSACYERLGNMQAALAYLNEAHIQKDSLLNMENVRSCMTLELNYQYKKQKEAISYQQALAAQKKEKHRIIALSLMLLLLSAVIVLGLLYRIQRNKSKIIMAEQESLSLQNENLQLKKNALEQELESKQREINIHAQYLLKRNEFVTDVINKISEEKEQKDMNKMLKDIQSNIEGSMLNEFNVLFQNLHSDFYVRLYEKHPDLTPNEKRLCTFIHLNMSSKEISSITQQSVKSIEIARSKLRSKLGLERKDNLCAYLQQF